MSYTSNEKGNFMMYVGLGLICMFVGYKYLSEVERVNKAVENFEKR